MARLEEVVLEDYNAVTDAMFAIDAPKAECFVPADKVQIFAAVEAMEGGFHALKMRVKAILREWVLSALEAVVMKAEARLGEEEEKTHYQRLNAHCKT